MTRREVGRHLKRLASRETTDGHSKILRHLESAPDPREEHDWDLDYRRQMLRWASARIHDEFNETHWRAFRLSAIECRPAEKVGHELGMSCAAVYAARSRITKRLRETILSVAAESWELEMAGAEKSS